VLQCTEIVVALVFVDISIHVARSGLLVGGAIALLALAVTAQGPLGFFRLFGQRLHRQLVMALSVLLMLAPVIPALRPDVQGIIVVEFGAVGLLRLCTLTRTSEEATTTIGRSSPGGRVVLDARVVESTVVDPSPAGPRATAAGKAGGPDAASTPRRAGRATGVVITTGKQAVHEHRPVVEEGVKRSIRNLGRWAGRLSSSGEKPDDPER
jgi:hypothetical protein